MGLVTLSTSPCANGAKTPKRKGIALEPTPPKLPSRALKERNIQPDCPGAGHARCRGVGRRTEAKPWLGSDSSPRPLQLGGAPKWVCPRMTSLDHTFASASAQLVECAGRVCDDSAFCECAKIR